MSDRTTIAEGRAAWNRIRQTHSCEDYIAIGRALLVGRRVCMKAVNADRPRGVSYVKANHRWLEANGFHDMPKAARACCLLLAEHEAGVVRWRAALPLDRRPAVNCQVVWRLYRVEMLERSARTAWRKRAQITETTAAKAWDDVLCAAKDAARGHYVSANAVEMIARAAYIATLNALEIAVPDRFFRPARSNGHKLPSLPIA